MLARCILLALLPESVGYLLAKGGQEAKVARYLSRIAPGIPAEVSFVNQERQADRVPGETVVHLGPRDNHAPAVVDLLHEPARSLSAEQLAAYGDARRRNRTRKGHPITSLFQVGGAGAR